MAESGISGTSGATGTGGEYSREDAAGLRNAVARAVRETRITDIHSHLFAPAFGGDLLRFGIDELLTYHYLLAEYLRTADIAPQQFFAMGKRAQADAVWQGLFLDQSPLSEATQGLLTVLARLGLDPAERDLDSYRAWWREQEPEALVERVLRDANVESVVMTNDPFDAEERAIWDGGYEAHPRFHAALRLDTLLNNWPEACEHLTGEGYTVEKNLASRTLSEVRGFLDTWLTRMGALYMAVSLPPDFAFPEDAPRARLLEEAVLPVAREHNLPFALMIGVKRQVNPALRLAGDAVGEASVEPLEALCSRFPQNKFMVTMLNRSAQHPLCVLARKFRNLLPFGCWWYMNVPYLVDEITRMRLELLGTSFIAQHSDARVLEEVLYKWDHSREILARVLRHKYADAVATGWTIREQEIRRDVDALLGGNFWRFLEMKLG